MSYKILNTDGTTLLILSDGKVDKSTTSLTLIGKNTDSYGEELNNNFIRLMANFASTSGAPPRSPLKGQLWYDTTVKRLKIYDNGFKVVTGVTIASSQPSEMQAGDLWFNSTSKQLNIYSSGNVYTVGPSFPENFGKNSWVLPESVIKDDQGDGKNVLLLRSYGQIAAYSYINSATNAAFTMDQVDVPTYMNGVTGPKTVVSGLTIKGDLAYTGKLWNNYLSISLEIPSASEFTTSNASIVTILNKVYPPNPVVPGPGSITTYMPGLPENTQARVVCKHAAPTAGYQVRIFNVINNSGTLTWSPSLSISGSNEI
jgi:hypothetical protein